jgi:tRNA A37 threonylcarbamoyladenosine dehydratase
MQARIVDNTRLSALTNKIMELVIDNIRMVHVNSKLLDYCKRQIIQSE